MTQSYFSLLHCNIFNWESRFGGHTFMSCFFQLYYPDIFNFTLVLVFSYSTLLQKVIIVLCNFLFLSLKVTPHYFKPNLIDTEGLVSTNFCLYFYNNILSKLLYPQNFSNKFIMIIFRFLLLSTYLLNQYFWN